MNQQLDRTGEIRYNNQNEKMTIIAYRSCKDIDVQFEDGTIRRSIQYIAFKKGEVPKRCRIEHKNKRIGQINHNKQNEKMTIIAYRSAMDIDVQFEDGTIRMNKTYESFKNGNIPKLKQSTQKIKRIGETNYNDQNEKMTIIAYRSAADIDVQFEDGTIRKSVCYGHFKNKALLKNKRKIQHIPNTTLTMKNGMEATLLKKETNWIIKFKDGYEILPKKITSFYSKKVNHPLRPIASYAFPTTINNFYITGIAYRSKNPNLYCTCTKCGYSDILTYDEMNEHQCEEPFNE